MIKISDDKRCIFDPISHTYSIGEKKLSGVTTFISKYKNKFDIKSVAENFAKKHNLDKNELILKWEKEGIESIKQGTQVHELLDNYFLNGIIENKNNTTKCDIAIKIIYDFFKTNRLVCVHSEYLIYDEYLGLASMIDCIVKNKDGDYFILDWKTNKKIEKNGYGKKMLYPFNNYPDSSFYHYSLQLSLYKRMLKNFNIKDCFIVHISESDYKFINYLDINESII